MICVNSKFCCIALYCLRVFEYLTGVLVHKFRVANYSVKRIILVILMKLQDVICCIYTRILSYKGIVLLAECRKHSLV